ncbi:Caltractin, partial [Symbiodinium necroappetens]
EEPDEFAFSAATLAVLAASMDAVQRSKALALYREACERGAACHLHSFEAGVIDLHGLLAEQAKLAASSRVQDRSLVWGTIAPVASQSLDLLCSSS